MSEIIASSENRALVAARMLREHYYPGRDRYSPDWILVQAVGNLMRSRPKASPEDLFTLLADPSRTGASSLMSRFIVASLAADLDKVEDPNHGGVNTLRGGRKFSFSKLSSMAAYFAHHSKKVCRIKLNQLLFYSDFVNYNIHGRSMSGARYVRHLNGAKLESYDNILETLVLTGVLKTNEQELAVPEEPSMTEFSILEVLILHWVDTTFGSLTGPDIAEQSQREGIYRFTRQDGYIAYEYSRLLQMLPDNNIDRFFD